MNAKKIAIVAMGSLLLAGSIAHAAPWDGGRAGRHHQPARADAFVRILKLADADKDGKVTREEAEAGFLKIFDEIDADKDGAATPGEVRAYAKARMEAFRAANPRPAAEATDGQEGGQEQAAREEGRRSPPRDGEGPRGPRHHVDRGDGPRHHADRGEGHRRFGRGDGEGRPMRASFLMRHADTDENGQVSRDEAKALGEKIFARLDTNKDGVISVDDLPDRPFP